MPNHDDDFDHAHDQAEGASAPDGDTIRKQEREEALLKQNQAASQRFSDTSSLDPWTPGAPVKTLTQHFREIYDEASRTRLESELSHLTRLHALTLVEDARTVRIYIEARRGHIEAELRHLNTRPKEGFQK